MTTSIDFASESQDKLVSNFEADIQPLVDPYACMHAHTRTHTHTLIFIMIVYF